MRRKEKVPNHKGAEVLGFGGKVEESSWLEILAAVTGGQIWGLYVVDRDPVELLGDGAQDLLRSLAFTAYQGSHANRFSSIAQWVLPSCSFAEEDATFTNFEGQVQRAFAAVPPLGESRPDWEIFRDMLEALGSKPDWKTPADVFAELARAEPGFAGMAFDGLGTRGRRLAKP